ncbi:MAG: tetratricopeptide repeat protein [Acidobacteriota bacterium]
MRALTAALLLGAWGSGAAVSPGHQAYEKANGLFVAQRFQEAFTAVEEALQLDPKLVPALTLKAKMAMAVNRFDVARQSLEQALAVDPHAEYAQFLYGMEAFLTNEMQQALPRFRKARELNPSDPRAALYLGLTCEGLGQTDEALALYREAVHLEQTAGKLQAETLLPGARLLLLLGRVDESAIWIRQALPLAPNSRDVHFEFARLLLKRGKPGQAAAEGETALRLANGTATDAQIHYLLIRAWQQEGNPDLAERHAQSLRALETAKPASANR